MIIPDEIAKILGDRLHDMVVHAGKDIQIISDMKEQIAANPSDDLKSLSDLPPEVLKYIAIQIAIRDGLMMASMSLAHNWLLSVAVLIEDLKIDDQFTSDQLKAINKQITTIRKAHDYLGYILKQKRYFMEQSLEVIKTNPGAMEKFKDMVKDFMDASGQAES